MDILSYIYPLIIYKQSFYILKHSFNLATVLYKYYNHSLKRKNHKSTIIYVDKFSIQNDIPLKELDTKNEVKNDTKNEVKNEGKTKVETEAEDENEENFILIFKEDV